jgi:hypothetical protein
LGLGGALDSTIPISISSSRPGAGLKLHTWREVDTDDTAPEASEVTEAAHEGTQDGIAGVLGANLENAGALVGVANAVDAARLTAAGGYGAEGEVGDVGVEAGMDGGGLSVVMLPPKFFVRMAGCVGGGALLDLSRRSWWVMPGALS